MALKYATGLVIREARTSLSESARCIYRGTGPFQIPTHRPDPHALSGPPFSAIPPQPPSWFNPASTSARLFRRTVAPFSSVPTRVSLLLPNPNRKSTATDARQLLEKGVQPRYELHGVREYRIIEKRELKNYRARLHMLRKLTRAAMSVERARNVNAK